MAHSVIWRASSNTLKSAIFTTITNRPDSDVFEVRWRAISRLTTIPMIRNVY